MCRAWIYSTLLLFVGCASSPDSGPADASVYPGAGPFPPREWTPTAVKLLEQTENAGYVIFDPKGARNPPVFGTPQPAPGAPSGTTSPALKPETPAADPGVEISEIGQPVSLEVAADGTPPMSFQWRKNGQAIAGETKARFSIKEVEAADAGTYDCIVKNAAGTAASAPVELVVRPKS